MPTTFSECPKQVESLTALVISQHHPKLSGCEARIGLLFATNPTGPALKIGGFPVTDRVRVVPLRDRANGLPDAQILIDETWWNDAEPALREAMLDRALSHLQPLEATDRDREAGNVIGRYKADDLGRPRLKFRHCDYMTSGFWSVIERRGEQAPEVTEFKAIGLRLRELVQLDLFEAVA